MLYWLLTLLGEPIAREIRRFKWMSLPARFYTAGFCLLLLRIALLPFMPFWHVGVDPLFLIPLPVSAIGFLIEAYRWANRAKKLSENNIVARFFILGGAAVATAVCMSYSSRIVNRMTGVAENPLPYTTAFVAVPSVMVVVFIFTFLFLVFRLDVFGAC